MADPGTSYEYFKSAILEKLSNCQNGTFEPLHEIQKFFWPKAFFWSIMKITTRKNIHNLSQGLTNPGLMQKKIQKGDFLKKDSQELKKFSRFRFLWISRRPGTLNWERVVFLPSNNLYRKCGYEFPALIHAWIASAGVLQWFISTSGEASHY